MSLDLQPHTSTIMNFYRISLDPNIVDYNIVSYLLVPRVSGSNMPSQLV